MQVKDNPFKRASLLNSNNNIYKNTAEYQDYKNDNFGSEKNVFGGNNKNYGKDYGNMNTSITASNNY
jgi:hypothetical protein